MDQRIAGLEQLVESLGDAVRRLERRVDLLEGGAGAVQETPPSRSTETGEPMADVTMNLPSWGSMAALRSTPALVGRSLLVLAGGFFLRALTEAGTLAPRTGVAFGLAYAGAWVAVAVADAHRGRHGSAGFYAACAALIANPLLFEAVTSFGVMSETTAALALAAMAAVGLVVAAHWNMHVAAWVFGVGALATAIALAMARPPGEASSAVVVLLGLGWLWLENRRGWNVLTWLTALAADVAVLRLTALAVTSHDLPAGFGAVHPWAVALLQAALVTGYVGASTVRALRGRRPLRGFDVAQTIAAWLVGWGGGLRLAEAQGWTTDGLSVFCLGVAAIAYAGAFVIVDRRHGRNRAFFFLSSIGLASVILGMPGIAGSFTAVVWAAIAVVVAVVGSQWDRVTLRAHSVAFLLAAWVPSHLAVAVLGSLSGGRIGGSSWQIQAMVVAALTVISTGIVFFGRRAREAEWVGRLPMAGLLAMSTLAVAAAMVSVGHGVASPFAVGLGTVALAGAAVGLALLASRWGVVEAGWLVYPMLVLTGLKVVSQDLGSGRAVVLVVALASYGTALVAAPRLLRSGRAPSGEVTFPPAGDSDDE
jgi:hypothetical protein